MDTKFIIAQVFGYIGLVLTIAAYQCKKHKGVMLLKTSSELFFAVQYFLLGTYTGMAMNFVSSARNLTFSYLVEKGKPLPALLINTGRIILCGILFSGVFSMFYSLCGGTLAVVMMIAASKCGVFSSVGVGISGAVAHNIGQILAASLVVGPAVFALLPPLMAVGVLTGTLTGLLVAILKKRRIGGM